MDQVTYYGTIRSTPYEGEYAVKSGSASCLFIVDETLHMFAWVGCPTGKQQPQ